MLDTYKLKIFATIVEKGSFTEAARIFKVSQPAVSQNIADLEKQLGVELLIRNRADIRPTEAGRELLRYASHILYWCERAEKHFLEPEGEDRSDTAILRLGDGSNAEINVEDGTLRIRMVRDGD